MDQFAGLENELNVDPGQQNNQITHLFDLTIPMSEWGTRPNRPYTAFIRFNDLRKLFTREFTYLTPSMAADIILEPLITPIYREIIMPENLSTFISSLITGTSISPTRLHQVATCAKMYLDRRAEILPNGMFSIVPFEHLEARQRQETLRYQAICTIILDTYSFMRYHFDASTHYVNQCTQYVLRNFLEDEDITSVAVKLHGIEIGSSEEYKPSQSMLLSWASNVSWANLLTNYEVGVTFEDILDFTFNLSTYFQGSKLRLSGRAETINPTHTLPVGDEFTFDQEADRYYSIPPIDNFTRLTWAIFIDSLVALREYGMYEILSPVGDSSDDEDGGS